MQTGISPTEHLGNRCVPAGRLGRSTQDACLVQGRQGGCAAEDGAEHRQQPLHQALCHCSRHEAARSRWQTELLCIGARSGVTGIMTVAFARQRQDAKHPSRGASKGEDSLSMRNWRLLSPTKLYVRPRVGC